MKCAQIEKFYPKILGGILRCRAISEFSCSNLGEHLKTLRGKSWQETSFVLLFVLLLGFEGGQGSESKVFLEFSYRFLIKRLQENFHKTFSFSKIYWKTLRIRFSVNCYRRLFVLLEKKSQDNFLQDVQHKLLQFSFRALASTVMKLGKRIKAPRKTVPRRWNFSRQRKFSQGNFLMKTVSFGLIQFGPVCFYFYFLRVYLHNCWLLCSIWRTKRAKKIELS